MSKPKPPTTPVPHILSEKFASPDLVDRLFEYMAQHFQGMSVAQVTVAHRQELELALREEFGGEPLYVRSAAQLRRAVIAREVLRLFNGRNATEVARELQISRAAVYRLIKQPGKARAKEEA